MTGIRSHAGQLSLGAAGILVLVLFVGSAFVPQELRADAASRIAELAQYVDTSLTDAWHSTFPSSASNNRASASAKHEESGSHPDAPLVLTAFVAPPSTAAGADLIDIKGLDPGSFDAGYGAGSASNSMSGLLRDIFKDEGLGGGLEAFVRSSEGWGSNPAGSGGASDLHSGGMGTSTGVGAAPVRLSRSSSSKYSPSDSTRSPGRNSEGTLALAEGTLALADVKSDAHNVKPNVKPNTHGFRPDARQDLVAGVGNGFVSVSDAAGASTQQVATSESLNDPFSDKPGASDWIGGPHNGGVAGKALDPTTGDPVGPSILPATPGIPYGTVNGLEDPRDGGQYLGIPVFQNEVSGSADANGGDGTLLDLKNTPANDPQMEDHGSLDKPVMMPEPDSGVSRVPEPRSLTLLSLGLGAIILWRKFRPAR